MKNEISTSPSQSQRLQACGVDPKTADMMWYTLDSNSDLRLYAVNWETPRVKNRKITNNHIPAYSLSRLLSLLPKDLMWQGLYYRLVMGPNEKGWEMEYNDLSVVNNCFRVKADTLIECCVKAIEWLTKNNYQLNQIEE